MTAILIARKDDYLGAIIPSDKIVLGDGDKELLVILIVMLVYHTLKYMVTFGRFYRLELLAKASSIKFY